MKNNLLCIDEYRNNPEFYFCKGLRYANKRNLGYALKKLQKVIELDPENCEYKFNIACFLSEIRRPKDASRMFCDILLNFDPTMHDCYFGLGCNSFEIGNADKAAEYFEKYLYFDNDGEFSEEVSEMNFYLKLYEGITKDSGFIIRSNNNTSSAKRYLQQGSLRNATRVLYKALSSNPNSVRARNLLTLTLMLQKNFERANHICRTVKIIDKDNVWANCLHIYILSHTGKHRRVNKLLQTLDLGDISNRDELLCVATTLLVFNKIDELILLLEMYLPEYNDSYIYSTLLLGYAITKNSEKFSEIYSIIVSENKNNYELIQWLEYIKCYNNSSNKELLAIDEYNRILSLNNEANNLMFSPIKYQQLYTQLHSPIQKLSKSYLPIIECVLNHREIMYSPYYKKEIIGILNECLIYNEEQLQRINTSVVAYAAALEYTYCKQYYIEMSKEELLKKYKLSSVTFHRALKNFKL